jgi:capsular polysaccharide transport system ATP-binding protein
MIRFDNVSKIYPVQGGRKLVLDSITAEFPKGKNTAILGSNGAGKSTLMRLMSGAELPDIGAIERSGSVSWPLGFGGGLHGSMTGQENVAFLARVYGQDFAEMLDFVQDFAEIGSNMNEPVRTYSSGMKARVAFGMSMAMAFDFYLIDEVIAVGDAAFKRKCKLVLGDRLSNSTVLLVSHSSSLMKDFCDHGCVLIEGRLVEFNRLDEAIAVYEEMGKTGSNYYGRLIKRNDDLG